MKTDEIRTQRNKMMDTKRRKRNALAQLRGEPVGLIDASPIRTRAVELFNLGWSYEAIIHASGAPGTAAGLRLIANGASRRAERKWLPVAAMPYTLAVPESVPDQCIVPSLGATRRIQSLMAQGWRHDDISEFIGRASHHLSSGRYPKMQAFDWRLVDLAFERLSASQGGSPKSLTRARKAGYLPAACWRDIDDPNGSPSQRRLEEIDLPDPAVVDRILSGDYSLARTATKAERIEIVARWRADGRPLNELERGTGWQSRRYLESTESEGAA